MPNLTYINWFVLATLLAATLATPTPAQAAGVVGTGTPASCTEAALNAALTNGGTVTFNCGGPTTIVLTGPKTIATNTDIDGGGVITLTTGLGSRVFFVEAVAGLTLTGITLDSAFNPSGDGGAIHSVGPLVLDNVTISNSQAGPASACGGALRIDGTAIIRNTHFRANIAPAGGGAICTGPTGSPNVQISDSSFDGNRSANSGLNAGLGGAILVNPGGTLTVINSRFTGNTAQLGGALHVAAGGTADLRTVDAGAQTFFLINAATDSGGAIYNLGTLMLSGVSVNGNSVPENTLASGYGGGLASLGTLTVWDSTFSANRGRFGGGMFVGGNVGAARAEINRSTFSTNTAAVFGGGLYTNVETTVISITQSSFRRNTAATGGGLARFNAQLRLLNSAVTLNTANTGGGLYVGAGPAVTVGGYVQVRNTTFSSNRLNAGGVQGGAVFAQGQIELYHTTIFSNTNGVYVGSSANLRFRSSVVHNPGFLNCDGDGSGQISNDSANHVTDTSCGGQFPTAAPDPQLGPLTNDFLGFGSTSYHMPQPGSPLINASTVTCPERDQRGAARIAVCDIGAVEAGGLIPRVYLAALLKN